MKTKLGVSVGLAAAGVYVLAVLGNYTAILLAVGYIFLMEEDAWLKKSALKALATMLCFSFLLSLLGLVPDGLEPPCPLSMSMTAHVQLPLFGP